MSATKEATFVRARTPHYDSPKKVGKRILKAREDAGLSQAQLAFPGCSAAYISRMERGERVPSLQVIREISKKTGVSEDWIAWGREKIDPDVAAKVEAVKASKKPDDLREAYKALASAARKAANGV